MKAHGFQQHLVAVGGAVKGAGTRRVVGLHLRVKQLGATYQALRGQLAGFGFFFVRQARRHWPGGHKHGGQVAKVQSAYQQPRHNFVAHAQHKCRVKHVVRQRHCGRHGNHVTAEQAQLHAGGALRHTVAHGRHAACHLRGSAMLARFKLDDVRVGLQRRMC